MKQDFKGLPIIGPLKRESKEKNSSDYVSNKQRTLPMTSPVNQRARDSHTLGKLRNGSLQI